MTILVSISFSKNKKENIITIVQGPVDTRRGSHMNVIFSSCIL